MLNDSFALNLTIPYYNFHQEQNTAAFGKVLRTVNGIGDITLMLMAKLSQSPVVYAGAGIKMPTGWFKATGEPIIAGIPSLYPTNMQLGTGTWDPSLAVFFTQPIDKFCLFGNSTFRYTGGNSSLGDRVGDELLVNIGASYMLSEIFSPLLLINGFLTGKDTGTNTRESSTGVTYIYAAPGIAYSPAQDLSFQLMVELPVYRYVNGIQVTPKYNISFISSLNF